MRIKPGCGYWQQTPYCLDFRRAGETGVELTAAKVVSPPCRKSVHGCDSEGTTADGRKVFFHSNHTDSGHAAP
jgi:hypothetical protein